ncbi:MAG TPA: cytochrome c oxidase subunit II [Pseudolabrys sp.]|nr:cytochrome c oxidase subunit II [Pseudolabrys sp.]
MGNWVPRGNPFWPNADSAYAGSVDLLFLALCAVAFLVFSLLLVLLLRFAIHYRAGNRDADRDARIRKSWMFESAWTAATFVGFVALFFWGATLYLDIYRPPAGADTIYVVGKQWMWKVQHLGGQREINELHIPVNEAVRLIMSSQDVIHSFFMPEFRIKHDVLPGTSEELWVKPVKTGIFHLFCAEYCGTDHSRMTGRIVVMQHEEFSDWLRRQDVDGTLAAQGAALFRQFGCSGCHTSGSRVRAPPLEGLYGRPVPLSGGTIEVADERYIRDSILQPRKQVVAGYEPLMPSFEGKLSEDELVRLLAYVKSLAANPEAPQ